MPRTISGRADAGVARRPRSGRKGGKDVSKRLLARVITVLLSVALLLVATLAGPAAANAPVAIPFVNEFRDLNPCTGLFHTVTVTGTLYVHDNNGALVVTGDRSITTSTGYEGRGRFTRVVNGSVMKVMLGDRLVSASGSVIDAGFHIVVDLSDGSVKHLKGGVTCARP
jgi:hypothetical protein